MSLQPKLGYYALLLHNPVWAFHDVVLGQFHILLRVRRYGYPPAYYLSVP
jgi:hypothetical protein